jgi:gluconolactonase
VIFPLEGPNGIGLSPDDKILYVAESWSGRVWSYEIAGPGQIKRIVGPVPWERGQLLIGIGGYSVLDSLAIDSDGNICVADIPYGGITVISPAGKVIEQYQMPDIFVTNICFGGSNLRTAYITLSSSGKLVAMQWPRPGLPLHWLNRPD